VAQKPWQGPDCPDLSKGVRRRPSPGLCRRQSGCHLPLATGHRIALRQEEVAEREHVVRLQGIAQIKDTLCWGLEGTRAFRHVRLLGEDDLRAGGLYQQSAVQGEVACAANSRRVLLVERLRSAQAELCLDSPRTKPVLGSNLAGPTKRSRRCGGIIKPVESPKNAQRLAQHLGMLIRSGPLDGRIRVINGLLDPPGSVSRFRQQYGGARVVRPAGAPHICFDFGPAPRHNCCSGKPQT
jgi:hypothetical protein